MNAAAEDVGEEVDLPDPEVQPLVHPLDVPAARGTFRTGPHVSLFRGAVTVAVAALVVGAARLRDRRRTAADA